MEPRYHLHANMPLLCSIVDHSGCNLTDNFKEFVAIYNFVDIMEKDV